MQAKLRLCIFPRDPLQRSCMSKARNAGDIAFARRVSLRGPLRRSCASKARNAGALPAALARPSAEIVRVERAECR